MRINNILADWTAESRTEEYCFLALAFSDPNCRFNDEAQEGRLPAPSPDFPAAFAEAFDPALSKKGCSLSEGSYVSQDRSGLFEELVRFYEHFGLRRAEDAELPDHVVVELQFMHFLTFMEHEGLPSEEHAASLQLAQRDFLSRHLLRLARGIQSNCSSADPRVLAMTQRLRQFLETDYEQICVRCGNDPSAANFTAGVD